MGSAQGGVVTGADMQHGNIIGIVVGIVTHLKLHRRGHQKRGQYTVQDGVRQRVYWPPCPFHQVQNSSRAAHRLTWGR